MNPQAETQTTASRLAQEEGVSKQAISKLVSRFVAAGMLPTQKAGREVYFDRQTFVSLRAAQRDPARGHLVKSPGLDAGLDANAVRTAPEIDMEPAALGLDPPPPDVAAPPSAAGSLTETAQKAAQESARVAAAKAQAAEVDAAHKVVRLKRELGQLVDKNEVEAETQKLLAPLRSLMLDGAPDLSRKLQGVEDERERTQIIRGYFRDGLNAVAASLRMPDAADHSGESAGAGGADGS